MVKNVFGENKLCCLKFDAKQQYHVVAYKKEHGCTTTKSPINQGPKIFLKTTQLTGNQVPVHISTPMWMIFLSH